MALIGQHQQTSFANPQNGQAPDADVIRANDNAVTAKHNAHDLDATIHIQTGTLAARPVAGTAGAVYVDENRRFYVDNGSAWAEVPYARLDAAGTNVFTNNVEVGGALNVGGTSSLGTVNAGAVTATSFTGTHNGSAAGLTGIPAANITGTLPAISGANLTNLNGSNISSGTVAAARLPTTLTSAITFSAGGAAVVVSNQGFVNFSAGAGAPGSAAAFNFNSDYNLVGANPAPALADAPIAGGGYRWVRVAYNGIGVGYIPMLV